jgi:hypothetical protein
MGFLMFGKTVKWVLRNVIGYALIALGIVLSIPFVPGQGLLTILVGLSLADWPGKRRFFRWLRSYHWFSRMDAWLHRKFRIRMPEASHAPVEPDSTDPPKTAE